MEPKSSNIRVKTTQLASEREDVAETSKKHLAYSQDKLSNPYTKFNIDEKGV